MYRLAALPCSVPPELPALAVIKDPQRKSSQTDSSPAYDVHVANSFLLG